MIAEKKNTQMNLVIIVLIVLNVLLGIYLAFFKVSAYSLEAMKAGWVENMQMARQLYKSPVYIEQQKATLEQILGSMAPNWQVEDTTPVAPQ